MIEQLAVVLKNILKNGFSEKNLEELEKIEIGNSGIYEVISQKIQQILKSKKKIEVVSLLQLIYAINITVKTISVKDESDQELFKANTNNKNKIFFDKTENILKLTLNKWYDLSAEELVSKIVNYKFNYYGLDYYKGNKLVYENLLLRYIKAINEGDLENLDNAIRFYGKDIASYIINNYDFTNFKKISGKLLVFCAEHFPEKITKLCFELLKLNPATSFKKYIYISLGLNFKNDKFLYDTAMEYSNNKKVDNLMKKEEVRGLYLGLLLIHSDYFKQFYEYLNKENTFKTINEIEREYLEICKKEKSEKSLKEIVYYYNETNYFRLYHHSYGASDYISIGDLKTISWDEKIETLLSFSEVDLSDVLKYIILYSSKENKNKYLEQVLGRLESGEIESDFSKKRFYLYNKEVFKDGSLEIKILSYIWNNIINDLENNYQRKSYVSGCYIDELASLYRLKVLRENLKLVPSQQVIDKLKNSSNNEIINIENVNLKRTINFNMKKLHLEDSITKNELRELTTLSFRLSSIKLEDDVIEHLINLKEIKFKDEKVENIYKIKHCSNLERLSLINYEETFDLEQLNNLDKLESLEIRLESITNLEKIKSAKYKHSLKKLEVSNFNYEKHKILLETFKNIETFEINSFEDFLIEEQVLKIKELKYLTCLRVYDTKVIMDSITKKEEKFVMKEARLVDWNLLRENFPKVKNIELLNSYSALEKEPNILSKFREVSTLNIISNGSKVPYFLKELDQYENLDNFTVNSLLYCVQTMNYKKTNQLDCLTFKINRYFSIKEIPIMVEGIKNQKIQRFELKLINERLTGNEILENVETIFEEIQKLNIMSEIIISYSGAYKQRGKLKEIIEMKISSWDTKAKIIVI